MAARAAISLVWLDGMYIDLNMNWKRFCLSYILPFAMMSAHTVCASALQQMHTMLEPEMCRSRHACTMYGSVIPCPSESPSRAL